MRRYRTRPIEANPLNPPCVTEHNRPYDYLDMPRPVISRANDAEKAARRVVPNGTLGNQPHRRGRLLSLRTIQRSLL